MLNLNSEQNLKNDSCGPSYNVLPCTSSSGIPWRSKNIIIPTSQKLLRAKSIQTYVTELINRVPTLSVSALLTCAAELSCTDISEEKIKSHFDNLAILSQMGVVSYNSFIAGLLKNSGLNVPKRISHNGSILNCNELEMKPGYMHCNLPFKIAIKSVLTLISPYKKVLTLYDELDDESNSIEADKKKQIYIKPNKLSCSLRVIHLVATLATSLPLPMAMKLYKAPSEKTTPFTILTQICDPKYYNFNMQMYLETYIKPVPRVSSWTVEDLKDAIEPILINKLEEDEINTIDGNIEDNSEENGTMKEKFDFADEISKKYETAKRSRKSQTIKSKGKELSSIKNKLSIDNENTEIVNISKNQYDIENEPKKRSRIQASPERKVKSSKRPISKKSIKYSSPDEVDLIVEEQDSLTNSEHISLIHNKNSLNIINSNTSSIIQNHQNEDISSIYKKNNTSDNVLHKNLQNIELNGNNIESTKEVYYKKDINSELEVESTKEVYYEKDINSELEVESTKEVYYKKDINSELEVESNSLVTNNISNKSIPINYDLNNKKRENSNIITTAINHKNSLYNTERSQYESKYLENTSIYHKLETCLDITDEYIKAFLSNEEKSLNLSSRLKSLSTAEVSDSSKYRIFSKLPNCPILLALVNVESNLNKKPKNMSNKKDNLKNTKFDVNLGTSKASRSKSAITRWPLCKNAPISKTDIFNIYSDTMNKINIKDHICDESCFSVAYTGSHSEEVLLAHLQYIINKNHILKCPVSLTHILYILSGYNCVENQSLSLLQAIINGISPPRELKDTISGPFSTVASDIIITLADSISSTYEGKDWGSSAAVPLLGEVTELDELIIKCNNICKMNSIDYKSNIESSNIKATETVNSTIKELEFKPLIGDINKFLSQYSDKQTIDDSVSNLPLTKQNKRNSKSLAYYIFNVMNESDLQSIFISLKKKEIERLLLTTTEKYSQSICNVVKSFGSIAEWVVDKDMLIRKAWFCQWNFLSNDCCYNMQITESLWSIMVGIGFALGGLEAQSYSLDLWVLILIELSMSNNSSKLYVALYDILLESKDQLSTINHPLILELKAIVNEQKENEKNEIYLPLKEICTKYSLASKLILPLISESENTQEKLFLKKLEDKKCQINKKIENNIQLSEISQNDEAYDIFSSHILMNPQSPLFSCEETSAEVIRLVARDYPDFAVVLTSLAAALSGKGMLLKLANILDGHIDRKPRPSNVFNKNLIHVEDNKDIYIYKKPNVVDPLYEKNSFYVESISNIIGLHNFIPGLTNIQERSDSYNKNFESIKNKYVSINKNETTETELTFAEDIDSQDNNANFNSPEPNEPNCINNTFFTPQVRTNDSSKSYNISEYKDIYSINDHEVSLINLEINSTNQGIEERRTSDGITDNISNESPTTLQISPLYNMEINCNNSLADDYASIVSVNSSNGQFLSPSSNYDIYSCVSNDIAKSPCFHDIAEQSCLIQSYDKYLTNKFKPTELPERFYFVFDFILRHEKLSKMLVEANSPRSLGLMLRAIAPVILYSQAADIESSQYDSIINISEVTNSPCGISLDAAARIVSSSSDQFYKFKSTSYGLITMKEVKVLSQLLNCSELLCWAARRSTHPADPACISALGVLQRMLLSSLRWFPSNNFNLCEDRFSLLLALYSISIALHRKD